MMDRPPVRPAHGTVFGREHLDKPRVREAAGDRTDWAHAQLIHHHRCDSVFPEKMPPRANGKVSDLLGGIGEILIELIMRDNVFEVNVRVIGPHRILVLHMGE